MTLSSLHPFSTPSVTVPIPAFLCNRGKDRRAHLRKVSRKRGETAHLRKVRRNAEKHNSFQRSEEVSGKLWNEGDAKGWTGPKREGDGQTSPAPSGWESGAGPAREASETGRLITKSRRWWRKAVSPGTFRTIGAKLQEGEHVARRQRGHEPGFCAYSA